MTDGFTITDKPAEPSFRIVTAHDLLAMPLPPRETILAPWLPSKGLAMIYGPRGIGKTHVALGAAYAVASGGRFLRWQAAEPRRVLILDGEMPAVTLQARLAAICSTSLTEPPRPEFLRFLSIDLQDRGLDLGDKADQSAIAAELADVDVIFCDNISTLAKAGRENEAESWLPVQEWALEQRRAGRSVVFIHHAGKRGAQRGTSRREDVLDTVISLRSPQDHRPDEGARFEVHFQKNRGFYGVDAKPFEAALGAGGWTMRDLVDPDMARVADLSSEKMSVRDIAQQTGLPKSTVSRLQRKARDAGMSETAGHG